MFADQARLKRAVAIARNLNGDGAIVREDGFATRSIAVIGRGVGLGASRRIAEMMRELAAERPLDEGFFEAADRGVEFLGRDRALPHKLVKNLRGDGRQRCVAY